MADFSSLTQNGNTYNVKDAEARAAIAELTNTNKRVIVITDSYGDATYSPSPWIDTLETLLNLGSGNYYKYFEGSMGYVHAGVDGHTAETLLTSKSSLIANHNTITDIVFGLGINDITHVADVSSAIASLIAYCKNNYVNAKIHIAFISNNSNKEGNDYLQNYLTLIANTQNAAQDNGAIFVQSAPYILHDSRLLNGVHPNADGNTAIAEFMCAYLKGLNPHVKFTQEHDDSYFNVKIAVDDGIATVNLKLKEHSGLTMTLPANAGWHLINDTSLVGLAVKSSSSDNPLIFFAHAYIDGGYKPIEFGLIQGKFYTRYRTATAATWDWSYVPDIVNGVFATLEC